MGHDKFSQRPRQDKHLNKKRNLILFWQDLSLEYFPFHATHFVKLQSKRTIAAMSIYWEKNWEHVNVSTAFYTESWCRTFSYICLFCTKITNSSS